MQRESANSSAILKNKIQQIYLWDFCTPEAKNGSDVHNTVLTVRATSKRSSNRTAVKKKSKKVSQETSIRSSWRKRKTSENKDFLKIVICPNGTTARYPLGREEMSRKMPEITWSLCETGTSSSQKNMSKKSTIQQKSCVSRTRKNVLKTNSMPTEPEQVVCQCVETRTKLGNTVEPEQDVHMCIKRCQTTSRNTPQQLQRELDCTVWGDKTKRLRSATESGEFPLVGKPGKLDHLFRVCPEKKKPIELQRKSNLKLGQRREKLQNCTETKLKDLRCHLYYYCVLKIRSKCK